MRQIAHTVACGLSLALLALPAAWHIKARNSGTLIFIFWAFLGNLVFLINNIVWNGNIQNPAPVWCDISSKLLIGFNVALPCASLCIQRRLYNITRVNQVAPTAAQRRMDIYIDLAIGIGAPVLMMALHVIVQPYRFNIIEDYGCWPVIYPSVAAYVMILPWPWAVSAISIVYSCLTIRAFLKRRSTFNELLKNQGGGLNVHRYIRLMALASIEVLFVFPMSLLLFIRNIQLSPPLPYPSWAYVHANFGRVVYTTRFILGLQHDGIVLMELSRWCMPVTAFMFFIFFGLASEARKQYKLAANATLKTFGFRDAFQVNNDNKHASLTTSSRKSRPSFLRKSNTSNGNNSTSTPLPLHTPIEKKRPDTFAWLEEGLPFDDLPYDSTKLPQSPDTAYTRTGNDGRDDGYMPCSPSTSASHASSNSFDKYGGAFDGDYQSTLGRQASISTARTARTSRTGYSKTSSFAAFARERGGSIGSMGSGSARDDDEMTICGVPTSLKRSDSMDKPLPEIPFDDFTKFRRSQASQRSASNENNGDNDNVDARRQSQVSVASSSSRHEQEERPQSQIENSSEVEPQVQVFVSSPTNAEFPRTPVVGDGSEQSTPVFVPRTLAPPASSPLNPANNLSTPNTRPSSMVSQDGAETVFFTPLPGRLSLGPVDLDEYPMPTINRNNAQ